MRHVSIEPSENVAVVRIDRPPANAFDLQMGLELQEAVREAGGAPAYTDYIHAVRQGLIE